MTCLEKYLQEHPDEKPDDVVRHNCPNCEGGIDIDDPSYCTGDNSDLCRTCWNRQVPGTEENPKLQAAKEKLQADVTEKIMEAMKSLGCGIKDSGSRTEFPSGAVRDLGGKDKGRCDLMPLDVVANLVSEYDGNPDPIIASIGYFQTSGDTAHLYHALERFAGKAFHRDNLGTSCCHMCLEVSKHFAEGCEKYGENNWMKGIPLKSYLNSSVRHYLKWLRGDKDENHHLAFCWNVMCALWTCKHKPELNDYGMKECPVCGEQLPNEAKSCDNCQVHLEEPENNCIICGKPIPAKWRYCDTCWENEHGG